MYHIQLISLSMAVLTVFVIGVLKQNREANAFLSWFILISAASYLPFFFWNLDMWKTGDLISIIFMPSNALHGVFIYFYTITLTGQKQINTGSRLLHLSVYAVLLVFHILSFLIEDSPRINGQLLTMNTLYIVGIGMISSLIYVSLAFIKMKNYSSDIRDYFSEIEKRDINWFIRILITPLIFFIISNAGFWYAFFKGPTPVVAVIILSTLCVSMFVILSLLINQPLIVTQNRHMYSLINNEDSENTSECSKYSRLNIDIALQKLYAGRLEEYMENEKPYLDERLTIKDLSEQLTIPYYRLSVVINNLYGKNFYNYVNEYRVSEVIKSLKKEMNPDVKMIDIAFRCGFNSKSTFNTVFKQNTGKTPTAYRREIQEKG